LADLGGGGCEQFVHPACLLWKNNLWMVQTRGQAAKAAAATEAAASPSSSPTASLSKLSRVKPGVSVNGKKRVSENPVSVKRVSDNPVSSGKKRNDARVVLREKVESSSKKKSNRRSKGRSTSTTTRKKIQRIPSQSSCGSSVQILEVLESDGESDVALIGEERKEFYVSTTCEICMENDKDAILMPCGHQEFCVVCVLLVQDKSKSEGKQSLCPYCMQPFDNFTHVMI
jgi:hypothetical protein